MLFHSEIDRKRQTEKDRHKHKHKKLYFLQHSTIEILHTCMQNTKTNQVMKITKSTNSVVTLDFVMQLVDCSIIIPPLNWTAVGPK